MTAKLVHLNQDVHAIPDSGLLFVALNVPRLP